MDSSGFFDGEGFLTIVTFFAAGASDAPPEGLLIEIFLGGSP
jgi:hypothetical protein